MQTTTNPDLVRELQSFLADSPSPFHATANLSEALVSSGFVELKEQERWSIQAGKKYFVTRNESSLVAFQLGKEPPEETGFRMVGAHTDSPCLKLKPRSSVVKAGNYHQAGVEIYGGVLLSTWFDRDLSLAGRVNFEQAGGLVSQLVDFKRPLAFVPNLAIHLNREVNEKRSINAQEEMPPILSQFSGSAPPSMNELLKAEMNASSATADRVASWDLCFYDTQKPELVGWNGDFLASARIDNLLSCFVGLKSFLTTPAEFSSVLVCLDHEEVGSGSYHGADSPFLESVLERVCPERENFRRALSRSYLVSTDNAHGVHPNYPDKHDTEHGPLLNQGPAIKVNAKQRYATDSHTAALMDHLAHRAEVPIQYFVSRSDIQCGSTIGPITAARLGVRTVDIGVPTFAMHSARELAGVRDVDALYRLLVEFFER